MQKYIKIFHAKYIIHVKIFKMKIKIMTNKSNHLNQTHSFGTLKTKPMRDERFLRLKVAKAGSIQGAGLKEKMGFLEEWQQD